MEMAEKGSLEDLLDDVYLNEGLPIDTVRFFLAEIVMALEKLRIENYCHRDLKPANILISK